MVVRTEVFAELDGFDPVLRVGEDVDLVWRLVAAGHRARYEPASTVEHRVRPTWHAWVHQRVAYGSSAASLARRHGDAVAPVVMSPWSAAVWALVALGHPVAGVALAVTTTARLRRRLSDLAAGDVARAGAGGPLWAPASSSPVPSCGVWWPPALLGAVVSRRGRRLGLLAAVTTGALAARRAGPEVGGLTARVRLGGLALLDDVAYGAGVWVGCWRERSVRSLLPRLSNAPMRAERR